MNEKTTLVVPKSIVLGTIILILCLFGFISATTKQSKITQAKDLQTLQTADLYEGEYVKCTIDRFLAKHVGDNDRYSGVGDSMVISVDSRYSTYTVELQDGRFLRVKISNIDLLEALNHFTYEEVPVGQFTYGTGTPVVFYGVVYKGEGINYSWYENTEGINPADVILNYEIRQKTVDNIRSLRIVCIIGMIAGVVLLISSGGVKKKVAASPAYRPVQPQSPVESVKKAEQEPAAPTYFVAQNPSWEKTKENESLQKENDEETVRKEEKPETAEKEEKPETAAEAAEKEEKPETAEKEEKPETAAEAAEKEETIAGVSGDESDHE